MVFNFRLGNSTYVFNHPKLIFLYFFALITEGFYISPCCSLELCVQMGISFPEE